jgi:hypothetical protein
MTLHLHVISNIHPIPTRDSRVAWRFHPVGRVVQTPNRLGVSLSCSIFAQISRTGQYFNTISRWRHSSSINDSFHLGYQDTRLRNTLGLWKAMTTIYPFNQQNIYPHFILYFHCYVHFVLAIKPRLIACRSYLRNLERYDVRKL